ncbi:dienelactone hydrolase family protein [Kitasatospora acidiphila]|uniref:Dienelactone hydrolase family protein n=1 Tax=Kitasatospora acidiphila TaxID=2567942 RepID=A0A540VWG7_9ACTN|nr:dienelactone hydrolase family protein [Kitasatospora acidiphila]
MAHEPVTYPGARHGITCADRPADHDPARAEDAWQRVHRVLAEHLWPAGAPAPRGRGRTPTHTGAGLERWTAGSLGLSDGHSLLPPADLVEDRFDGDDAERVHGLVRAPGVEEADHVAEEAFAVPMDARVLGDAVADVGEPVAHPERKLSTGGDDDRRGVLGEAGGVAIGSATDVVGTVGRSCRWGGHPQGCRGAAHPVPQIRPVGRPQSRVLTARSTGSGWMSPPAEAIGWAPGGTGR